MIFFFVDFVYVSFWNRLAGEGDGCNFTYLELWIRELGRELGRGGRAVLSSWVRTMEFLESVCIPLSLFTVLVLRLKSVIPDTLYLANYKCRA